MGWIVECFLQGFWEITVDLAYRKWGWPGGIAAFVLPIAALILIVWLLVR